MGMFDTVIVRCPHCGQKSKQQTKNGPCRLLEVSLPNAPLSMLHGIDGRCSCEHCTEFFHVKVDEIFRKTKSDKGEGNRTTLIKMHVRVRVLKQEPDPWDDD